MEQVHEHERAERNAEITKAAFRWMQEQGYRVAWDGEFYIILAIGILGHGDQPVGHKFTHREDAYYRAFQLAAKVP